MMIKERRTQQNYGGLLREEDVITPNVDGGNLCDKIHINVVHVHCIQKLISQTFATQKNSFMFAHTY